MYIICYIHMYIPQEYSCSHTQTCYIFIVLYYTKACINLCTFTTTFQRASCSLHILSCAATHSKGAATHQALLETGFAVPGYQASVHSCWLCGSSCVELHCKCFVLFWHPVHFLTLWSGTGSAAANSEYAPNNQIVYLSV